MTCWQALLDNSDILHAAGNVDKDMMLDEDEAVAILVNSGQLRRRLHEKALDTVFFKSRFPGDRLGSQRARFFFQADSDHG